MAYVGQGKSIAWTAMIGSIGLCFYSLVQCPPWVAAIVYCVQLLTCYYALREDASWRVIETESLASVMELGPLPMSSVEGNTDPP